MQEALLLSDLCKKVYLIQNLDRLTGENKLQEQLKTKANVEIILSTIVKGYLGSDKFEGVDVVCANGDERSIALDGLFVAIGLIPQNGIFKNVLDLNEYGYAEASEDCRVKTNGVFVAGDCRSKKIRQVATAMADGAVAALAACDYVDGL